MSLRCPETWHLIASGRTDGAIYFNLGLTRMNLGDDHGAIAAFSRSIDDHPDSWANRGLSYERIGDLVAARSDYEMALEHDPADTVALVNLGTLLVSLGDVDSAMTILHRAAEEDPSANWQLSGAYLAGGDVERAQSSLETAVSAGEDRALVDMAVLALVDGDRRRSDDILARAASAGIDIDSEEIQSFLAPLQADAAIQTQVRERVRSGDVRETLVELVWTVIDDSFGSAGRPNDTSNPA